MNKTINLNIFVSNKISIKKARKEIEKKMNELNKKDIIAGYEIGN